jgi:hypothetical protein
MYTLTHIHTYIHNYIYVYIHMHTHEMIVAVTASSWHQSANLLDICKVYIHTVNIHTYTHINTNG